MPKNIIVLMDGTWDTTTQVTGKDDALSTNIAKLKNILTTDISQQLVYYDDGIGADGDGLSKLIDGATGLGINDKIIQGYQFIMQNFTNTDNIYLFGFSRGAYTVRYIADFIAYMGLLKLINNESTSSQFQRINTYFNQYKKIRNSNVIQINSNLAQECTIKMIGVWDTVGSLGIPLSSFNNLNRNLYEFQDTILHANVLSGYQALAIDEKRSEFEPCLWTPRDGVTQVWFTGSHSDIGGGYEDSGLSDITLDWMANLAYKEQNILIDEPKLQNLKPNPYGILHDSTKEFPYNILAPKIRTIPENSLVKNCVKIRMENQQSHYNPINLPKLFKLV